MAEAITIPAGTSALDVVAMLGWSIVMRPATPRERLLHGLRELLDERRAEAEEAWLRVAGLWCGDE